jgi:hypothetical protein
VRVPVPEPYPVEVPVGVPEPYPVEVPVHVETPRSFPAIETYAVEQLLSAPCPRAPLSIGKPFPYTTFSVSEPHVYSEAFTTSWPGTFHGLSPYSLKEGFPFHRYGHYGKGF